MEVVKKSIIYFSSRCVAQDDVAMASCVVSQEGKKWNRTCYQVNNDLCPLQVQHSLVEVESNNYLLVAQKVEVPIISEQV